MWHWLGLRKHPECRILHYLPQTPSHNDHHRNPFRQLDLNSDDLIFFPTCPYFLVSNTVLGRHAFQQTDDIPMSTNCAPLFKIYSLNHMNMTSFRGFKENKKKLPWPYNFMLHQVFQYFLYQYFSIYRGH